MARNPASRPGRYCTRFSRVFTVAVSSVSLYVLIWRLTNRERGAEAASGAGKPARTAARCEAVANKSVAHARGKLREARRRLWEALRAATIALIGARMSSDTLWSEPKETHRKGELERALEAHTQ